jgi:hypothetical protein
MQDQPPPVHIERKYSGTGIASFAISIGAGLAMFGVFAIAGVMQASKPGGMDEKSAGAIVVGLCMIGLLGIDVVAAGLGVAGLLQTDRKKLFAVLGTIFSSLTIACTLALILLGLVMKRA